MLRRLFIIMTPVAILVSIYVYLYQKEENALPENNLVVYTYSSFADAWGAGPELKKLFKVKTGATVSFVDVGEAGIIIQRVMLENKKTTADIVLGLDQFNLSDSKFTSLFSEPPKLEFKVDEAAPAEKIKFGDFVAYCWSPITLIHRSSDKNFTPQKLEDLLSSNFKDKIILLDPRTSAPGYIFFHWLVQTKGEEGAKDFVSKIKKSVYTVTPSWSMGYGLFKNKQADYIFSYLTSPVYHWIEEKNYDYQPLYLEDPLPYHIEYAGILKSTRNQRLAEDFIKFLYDKDAQRIIMDKNYMLPITAGVVDKSEFTKLKKVALLDPSLQISRDAVLNVWKSISW